MGYVVVKRVENGIADIEIVDSMEDMRYWLSQIPDVDSVEARRMLAGLRRAVRRAEKAARRAGGG